MTQSEGGRTIAVLARQIACLGKLIINCGALAEKVRTGRICPNQRTVCLDRVIPQPVVKKYVGAAEIVVEFVAGEFLDFVL